MSAASFPCRHLDLAVRVSTCFLCYHGYKPGGCNPGSKRRAEEAVGEWKQEGKDEGTRGEGLSLRQASSSKAREQQEPLGAKAGEG